jgi:hypothetical protein
MPSLYAKSHDAAAAGIASEWPLGFVKMGKERGWFKTSSPDGMPLKTIAFDNVGPACGVSYAQEAMEGGKEVLRGSFASHMTDEQRQDSQLFIRNVEGEPVLCWKKNDSLVDTKGCCVDYTQDYDLDYGESKLSYVMDDKKNLYLFKSLDAYGSKEGFVHASVLSARPVICAGNIGIEAGKITFVDNLSGHYQPKKMHLDNLTEIFKESGVLSDKCKIKVFGSSDSKFIPTPDAERPVAPPVPPRSTKAADREATAAQALATILGDTTATAHSTLCRQTTSQPFPSH